MRRRVGLLVLLVVAAVAALVTGPVLGSGAPAGSAARASLLADARSVVVVGVPGLRWSDVTPEDMPRLHRLATTTAAVGSLSVKARPPVSCAADGFLTLGAGARAEAFDVPCGSAPTTADLPDLRDRNASTRDAAPVGLLGAALDGGDCVNWNGPLSFSAHGRRPVLLGGGSRRSDVPGAPVELLSTAGAEGGLGACRLTLLEATVVGGDGGAEVGRVGSGARARAAAASAADALVAAVDDARPDSALLVVVGVSEAPTDEVAHLHVALADGPDLPRGALRSASTRRDGVVQLVDVAPTVLELLRLTAPEGLGERVVGEPWRSTRADAPTLAELVDADRKATVEADVRVPFFVGYLGLLVGLLVALWRRREAARVVALAGAAVPMASYLANLLPWWRAGAPLPALLGLALAAALVVGLVAARLRGRLAAVAVVLLATVAVLLADLLTGAHLQLGSVAGYSSLVAGRFAGLGNVAFGVLAAAVVLGAAATRSAPLAVLLGGLTAVTVGAPPFGSDVGGVLALVPAFAVLALRLAGRRVSVLRVLAAGAAGAAVVTAFALVDRARPEDERTHLGRFAQQVLDGEAGAVLRRKAEAVLGLLFHSPVTALLPLAVALAVLLVVRPPAPLRAALDDAPAWRSGLVALGVACAIGFALNDSGAAVPALALVVALPATAAVVLSGASSTRDGPDR